MLPHQQVLKAHGKASIDTLALAPNSSVLILDETAPLVWMCISDSIGNVTATPYDIAPHIEEPQIDLDTRLRNIEASISELLKERENGKSNAQPVKSKSDGDEFITSQKYDEYGA